MADLDRLLPWEVARIVAGYHRRLRRQREQAAEHAAWVLWPYCGGRLSAADLLGESEASDTVTLNPRDYPTTEAFMDAVREAQERQSHEP